MSGGLPRRLAIPKPMEGAALVLISLYSCHPRRGNDYKDEVMAALTTWSHAKNIKGSACL
jgi:hypothetical protein